MGIAIGMAEFKSIVVGIEAADKMIKAANVNVMMTRTVCPGKFIVMLSGSVEDVKESINFAVVNMKKYLLDYFVIPNIHDSIPEAFKRINNKFSFNAIGAMEYNRAASGIRCLDIALKTADVELVKLNFGGGINGKCYFILSGAVSDIKEALYAAETGSELKRLMHSTVIPNPSKELIENLY